MSQDGGPTQGKHVGASIAPGGGERMPIIRGGEKTPPSEKVLLGPRRVGSPSAGKRT